MCTAPKLTLKSEKPFFGTPAAPNSPFWEE
jgi:hypothetical protein